MIQSVLAQTYSDFEFLILNDGGSEATEYIRARYPDPRIRLMESPGIGRVPSRNIGLREAKGELLALIDSDDIAHPRRLELQVEFLRRNPGHVLVGSTLEIIDERSATIGIRDYPEEDAAIRREMLAFNCLATSAVTLRTEAARKAGGYSEEAFICAEDYDLWLRMGKLGAFHNLRERLARYRIHAGAGKSRLTKLQLKDTIAVKLHAIRRYPYPWTARATAVLALQIPLCLLPSGWILALFRMTTYRREPVA
jgi:glycosyltransferase involved in cell wall biosynthesis